MNQATGILNQQFCRLCRGTSSGMRALYSHSQQFMYLEGLICNFLWDIISYITKLRETVNGEHEIYIFLSIHATKISWLILTTAMNCASYILLSIAQPFL
jgi:hypothetical protein